MLTGTKAFVRTNYGDTDPWDVEMGVVQGSVLAAVLFLVFVSTLPGALARLSPTINGLKIPPQLFADDGNLFAIGARASKAIVEGCEDWSNLWKMIINGVKSNSMSMQGNEAQIFRDRKAFLLVAHAVLLGVGVDTNGVFTVAFLRELLKRLADRIKQIMRAGVRLGALRPDMGLFLYTTLAQSIIQYSLPMMSGCPMQAGRLDAEQAKFAKDFLSLPPSTPDYAARAELGLFDYDLMADMAMLMLQHKVHRSRDSFTKKLTHWKMGDTDTSLRVVDSCTAKLNSLAPTTSWPGFLRLPRIVAKRVLRKGVLRNQKQRWEHNEAMYGYKTENAGLSKPH
jgi:hypothetical protein